MSAYKRFDIMREPVASLLDRLCIKHRKSHKGMTTWHNMAKCPLCGHEGYQCAVSESLGASGGLVHGVKCWHAADNGFGTDTPGYEDFLFAVGALTAGEYGRLKTLPPCREVPMAAAARAIEHIPSSSRETLRPLNPDFHGKLRKRLRENAEALRYLECRGLLPETLDHFGLGLSTPYTSRRTKGEQSDALVYPLKGHDGRFYNKYGYYNIPGVTKNPVDQNGWMSGEVRTYYATPAEGRKGLFVCEGAKDLWRNWQALRGVPPGDGLLLITSTHGSAFPAEWKDPSFWAGWEAVYFGHDSDEAGDLIARKLAELTGREARRVSVPAKYGKDWTDFWQHEGGLDEFCRLLDEAPVVSQEIGVEEAAAGYGRFAYRPVNINGAYHNGHLYYAVRTLNRSLDVTRRETGEEVVHEVERLETVVVRSDRTVHSASWAAAPKGTRDRDRVLRLSDGTLIDREPQANKYGTWSWDSIKAYLDGRSRARPLAAILRDVSAHLRSSVWLPYEEDYVVLALTVPVTYAQAVFDSVPLIFLNGPPGSGKSEMGRAMARVCANAYVCGQSSAASIARFIDESRGFVVLDDLEVIGNRGGEFSELVQALKLSYNKSTAVKLWTDVKTMRTHLLDFYGVKMINNTQGADQILGSRMLRIQTRKIPERLREEFGGLLPTQGARLHELRDELHTWTFENVPLIDTEYRALYPKGTDRSDEITAPLRVMASLAGDTDLRSRLEVALTRQKQKALDPDDPREVLHEALKNLVAQGYEMISITHLVLEMRGLIAGDYGRSFTNEIPEWARPEWVGRMLRSYDLIDPDPARSKRMRVHGANLRFYPVRPSYVEEVRAWFAAQSAEIQVGGRGPADFCGECENCPFSALSCEIMARRQGPGRAQPARREN